MPIIERPASFTGVVVRSAGDTDQPAWDAFIDRHPVRTHAFSWSWRGVIAEAFGHEPHYLVACGRDGAIVGVLPLFFIRSVLFGQSLVSMPYLSGGGIVADSDEVVHALHAAARELGARLEARRVEMRHRGVVPAFAVPDGAIPALTVHTHKVAMVLPIVSDPDAQFDSFPSKLRTRIRRPMRSHLTCRVSDGTSFSGAELAAYFSVYSERMRDLGTPAYPQRFFALALKSHGARCRLVTVWEGDVPAAGGIVIASGEHMENPWVSASRRHDHLSPNLLVYWEMIKAGCLMGCREFDFGRSTIDSGTYQFKSQWGATPRQLYWHHSMLDGDAPEADPHRGDFSLLVRVWQRLPMTIANRLGPWITRSLP